MPPRDPNGMSNDDMTREIYMRIVGDGTNDNPGLDKRVDRLESKMNLVFGGLGLIVTGTIGYAVTWALGLFQGKKGP